MMTREVGIKEPRPTDYVALPIMLQSRMFFLSTILCGWFADRFGRRRALIITALTTIPVAPLLISARGPRTMMMRSSFGA
jgi:MFS family permease